MNYQFKQSVRIKDQTFKVGINDVPEYIEEHPDFTHYVQCGWIAEADKNNPPPRQETFLERAQRLQKRIADRRAELEKKVEPAPKEEPPKKGGRKKKTEESVPEQTEVPEEE